MGNFQNGNSAMAAFSCFFQTQPYLSSSQQMYWATAQKQRFYCQELLWLWLQNGSWAVAQELGQLPLWIHGTIWATAHISCMILAATGGTPLSPCRVRARSGWPGRGGCSCRDRCGFTGRRRREWGEEPSP